MNPINEKSQIVTGIDVGSAMTKVVILRDSPPTKNLVGGEEILARSISATLADPRLAVKSALEKALQEANLTQDDLDFIVTTGYGRRAIEFGNRTITEITANAKGARFLGSPWGQVRTVIDLGAQDSKVIKLDEQGEIVDFVMNEKCAAGTGRFLEVMARTLDIKLEDLGEFSLKSKNSVKINATCTVFAESEVISLIAQRKKREDILAGLYQVIAKKIADLARALTPKEVVFFDGGGAKNIGIKKALEEEIGFKIYVPPEPQFVIALGAALSSRNFNK